MDGARRAMDLELTDDVAYEFQQAIDQPARQLVRIEERDDECKDDQPVEDKPQYGARLPPRTWGHWLRLLLFEGYEFRLAGDAAHPLPQSVLWGQAGGAALAAGKGMRRLAAGKKRR